jgi:hypothetical protein
VWRKSVSKKSDILSHLEPGEEEYIAAFKEHKGRRLNFVVEVDEARFIARLKFEVVDGEDCAQVYEYKTAMRILTEGIEAAPQYSLMARGAA